MKALLKKYLLMIPLLLAIPNFSAIARNGGIGDGGGNGIGSSPAQVIETLERVKARLGAYIHLAANDPMNALNPALVKDKRVKKVLQSWLKMEGNTEAFVNDTNGSEYKPQKDKCHSQSEFESDASTAYKRNAPICFSVSRLTRFPKWALEAEITSLAAHEHAHHFGFGEEDARAVQAYIFNAFGILQIQSEAQRFLNSNLENYRARVKTGYSPAGSASAIAFAKTICRNLYLIEGQAIAYKIDVFARMSAERPSCDPENFDPDAVEQRLRKLIEVSIRETK